MFKKINIRNCLLSACIGLIIGILSIYSADSLTFKQGIESLLRSGSLGLLIGTVVEAITALLPISIAKPKSYFFINNLLAVFVTFLVVLITSSFYQVDFSDYKYQRFLILILLIVFIVNILEYYYYIRTNKKLDRFKRSIENRNRDEY